MFTLSKKECNNQPEKVEVTSEAEETSACEVEETVEEQLRKELEKQKDLFLRTAAEYDNYKKRTLREKEELSEFTKASFLKDLLPAVDNFKRAADAGMDNVEEFKKGMDMSIKMFMDILFKLGLKEIECEGKEFDPNFHYAVSKIEDENLGENIIAQVFQTGYTSGDTVIRPAMVVVANCN